MRKELDVGSLAVCKKMMEEMFQIRKGETVILTADSGTDMNIVEGFVRATADAGGKPMVLHIPTPRGEGQEASPDLPAEAMIGSLCNADIWLEFNSRFILYSDVWETVMRENKKLRYLIIYDTTMEQLSQIVNKVDISLMGELLKRIRLMLEKAKKIRVTSARGTDFTFELDPKHIIDLDDGNYSTPKFGTLPGYVNVVPKFNTMEGNIVFDELMGIGILKDAHVEFVMEKGKIIEFRGGEKAEAIRNFVEGFDDENMFKISHMMISLNPGVRSLTGSVCIDERIYGGVDLGFGHTSPIDAPPLGQPAKSHFDGILENTSVWIDDMQITKDGVVIHKDLAPIAEKLLEYASGI